MTRIEIEGFIKEFSDRKNLAINLRNKLSPFKDIIQRHYLQGGIDTLNTIIESLQKKLDQ